MSHFVEILASTLFLFAVLHTFSVKRFQHLALRFNRGSRSERLFHILGEVEIVFGIWAGILILCLLFLLGPYETKLYLANLSFDEPLFVFVIMAVAGTRPLIHLASAVISALSARLPMGRSQAFYFTSLVVGPLLGSVITEPAAMTVTALLLKDRFFSPKLSPTFLYGTLAVLFVNISIGSTFTPYAAPPVLMVAAKWKWGLYEMISLFGWKSAIAVLLNSGIACFAFKKNFSELNREAQVVSPEIPVPAWLTAIHIGFLLFTVACVHHPLFCIGGFLAFYGVVKLTEIHQKPIALRDSLFVAIFLAGLVVLGGLQSWWLKPLIAQLEALPLFLGATILTAFMDNASLTYLGAQVSDISDSLKYALVAGAVSGGGLTIIANAPNPAGVAILRSGFGETGISPVLLFLYALLPTLIAMACFWFLP